MPEPRRRVAVYVTRTAPGGRRQVLVFDHLDFPEAGTQVPAGGIEPGESVVGAAIREVLEETGMAGLSVVAEIGTHVRDESITTFVHAVVECDLDRWMHTVSGSGVDRDLRFECSFREVAGAELAGGQAEFLGLLG